MPEEYLGEVVGQLNSPRGEMQGMDTRPGNAQAVRAMVPAGRDVRICNRIAFSHPGTRRFYDGI